MRSLYLRFLLNLIGSLSLFVVSVVFAASSIRDSTKWGIAEIRTSLKNLDNTKLFFKKPQSQIDFSNLYLIIEADKLSVSIINIKQGRIIHHFVSTHTLQDDSKFSPNRHFVYLTSSDGWISKFDMLSLKVVSTVRVGIQTRNLAVSADGRYLVAANEEPKSLVILNASNLEPIKLIEIPSLNGKSSRVGSIFTAEKRQSFIVALKDHDEVWEILYQDDPLPVYNGLMHDYRLGEGLAKHQGSFPIRQIKVNDCTDNCLDNLVFFPSSDSLIIHNGKQLQILQMDARRKIAEMDLADRPNLGVSIFWSENNIPFLATTNLNKSGINIIDMNARKMIKSIKTDGPVFMLKEFKNSNYILAGVNVSPNKDVIQVIDKDSLITEQILEPSSGNRIVDVKFDEESDRIILITGNNNREIVVYEMKTMSEIKRIPITSY